MRPSRFELLSSPGGIVHLFWRCHNRERLLMTAEAKKLFFASLIFGLKHRGTDGSVKLHAFCLMDNHVHQQMTYENGPSTLSHCMRVAHGVFGRRYNVRFGRSGAVANDRPKTPLIGDSASQMRVHFYIEANPIRAGMTSLDKLRYLPWNSYRYYAYGITDQWTENITPPQWYLDLGDTPEERQRAYRKLFREYLALTPLSSPIFLKRFIGTPAWVISREEALKYWCNRRRSVSARASPD